MKNCFVAIIGRANAGKSTLLNTILGEKIAITSDKAGTTRNAIIGIYNDEDSQIVFTDTPGIVRSSTALGDFMYNEAHNQIEANDLILYLFDSSRHFDQEDEQIVDELFSENDQVFLVLTKIDLISKERLIKLITYLSQKYPFKEIIPLSAKNKENIDELIKTIKDNCMEGPRFYSPDEITNLSLDFRIREIIREKILNLFYQEVPHQIAVVIEQYKETEKRVYIDATIIVGHSNHKAIIIGKSGNSLKRINMESSREIGELTNKKVMLSLYVKVDEQWFDKEHKIAQYGYDLKMQNE